MRRENWPSETIIVDKGRHNVEVPLIGDTSFFCPHGRCEARFRRSEIQKFIHHRAQAHDIDHSTSKECECCGENFTVPPSRNDQKYCSKTCANQARSSDVESREEVIADIRQHLDDPADAVTITKKELVEIRDTLATDSQQQRQRVRAVD